MRVLQVQYKIENRTINFFCKVQLFLQILSLASWLFANISTNERQITGFSSDNRIQFTSRVLAFKREIKMFNFLSTSLEILSCSIKKLINYACASIALFPYHINSKK